MSREGTVGHAISLSDGAHVYIDAAVVDKIKARQTPKYFTIRECFDWKSCLIVYVAPSAQLRHGQTVDVEGTITTLPNGNRAIVSPTVYGYLDSRGNLLYHGPLVKGPWAATPWQWKTALTAASVAGVASVMSDSPTPPGEPSPDSPPAPIQCATIAEARAAYSASSRVLVALQCRPLRDPVSGHFVLLEDGSSDEITVYYTNPVTATDRVNKLIGTIQKDAGSNYWIEVDSGPNWQAQDVVGSVQVAATGTIAWARTFADWTELPTDGRQYALENVPVSWCDGARVYVEEADRCAGILLEYVSLPPSDAPYVVSINGTVNTNFDGERCIEAYDIAYASTTTGVKPLGMSNKNTTAGPDPSGLLLRVWGKVTAINSVDGYIYIDDGSALSDGTTTETEANVGVRVLFSDTYFPSVGDYAVVSGPLGRAYDYTADKSVKCVRTKGLLDTTLFFTASSYRTPGGGWQRHGHAGLGRDERSRVPGI